MHKIAVLSAESLKIMCGCAVAIDQQLSSIAAAQIAQIKQKLHPIVKTMGGIYNFALRGHWEGEDSKNPGNFKALSDFHETAPKTATYISKMRYLSLGLILRKVLYKKLKIGIFCNC